MNKQERNKSGKFLPKSEEMRKVRSIRLTDSTWEKLGDLANERSITRADLLEEWMFDGITAEQDNLSKESADLLDLTEIRDLFLSSLKVGSQSPKYKNAVKCLKEFIPFLENKLRNNNS